MSRRYHAWHFHAVTLFPNRPQLTLPVSPRLKSFPISTFRCYFEASLSSWCLAKVTSGWLLHLSPPPRSFLLESLDEKGIFLANAQILTWASGPHWLQRFSSSFSEPLTLVPSFILGVEVGRGWPFSLDARTSDGPVSVAPFPYPS